MYEYWCEERPYNRPTEPGAASPRLYQAWTIQYTARPHGVNTFLQEGEVFGLYLTQGECETALRGKHQADPVQWRRRQVSRGPAWPQGPYTLTVANLPQNRTGWCQPPKPARVEASIDQACPDCR